MRSEALASLVTDVLGNHIQRGTAAGAYKVRATPQYRLVISPDDISKLSTQSPGCYRLEGVHQPGQLHLRIVFNQQMHVISLPVTFNQGRLEVTAHLGSS